jgi:hypothetical protein
VVVKCLPGRSNVASIDRQGTNKIIYKSVETVDW